MQQVGVLLERLGQRRVIGQRLRMGYRRLDRCTFEWEPFRPVALDPAWLKPNVASLAQAADEERQLPSGELDVARLAVVADALEEAGAPAEVVAHLRSPGPHVRGCWPVDLCLGLS